MMEAREEREMRYRALEEKRAAELHDLVCTKKRLDIQIKEAQLRQLQMARGSESLSQPRQHTQNVAASFAEVETRNIPQSLKPESRQVVVIRKLTVPDTELQFSI